MYIKSEAEQPAEAAGERVKGLAFLIQSVILHYINYRLKYEAENEEIDYVMN